jgi:serine protease Do
MIRKRSGFNRVIIFSALIIISNLIIYHFPGLQSNIHAQASNISQESVDILTRTGQAMAEVAEGIKPAIVNISTTRTHRTSGSPFAPFFDDPLFRKFFGDRFGHQQPPKERKTASLGSGVIVSSDGYILTNNHVIKDADEINVLIPDKREFKGKIIGSDPKTDIAVIKIEASDLPTITWGDSGRLRVGEIVLAIGSPYGLSQTVTMGIVSAVERVNMGIADYVDFIQTDAAINPGNSGGALVNAKGELVGINTAIFSTSGGYQGIGFAIPSSMAKTVMDSLITKGKVTRGWLGVSIQEITPELARQFQLENEEGSLVADVVEGSPAEKAGILRGDVIIEFNGKKVSEPHNLRNAVASTPPEAIVELKIIRDGSIETITVTLGELSSDLQKIKTSPAINNALRGVSVQNLTPEIYKQLDIPEKIRGVLISGIEAGSPAETKLLSGDVILEINRKATANTDDYEKVVTAIKEDENILLLVFRRGSSIFITISGERDNEESLE